MSLDARTNLQVVFSIAILLENSIINISNLRNNYYFVIYLTHAD